MEADTERNETAKEADTICETALGRRTLEPRRRIAVVCWVRCCELRYLTTIKARKNANDNVVYSAECVVGACLGHPHRHTHTHTIGCKLFNIDGRVYLVTAQHRHVFIPCFPWHWLG